MDCIYLLHPRKYDELGKTFPRDAFRNNGGSFSVIDGACAGRSTICAYIRRFYSQWTRITSNPAVFLRFDSARLPAKRRLKDAGKEHNPCHVEVFDLEDEELGQVFENTTISQLEVCHSGVSEPIEEREFLEIKARYEAETN